ncbi:hypothetical protein BA195_05875 [Tenacibaculum soleae]|uniref:Uncharacterized protein n=1 Tax=Tenacibaculum soleae TaxID=447689 RepID=A0A1B9Y337_9FLAO|nr:hypothetical protein [Tenacibaculum soleae]OCK44210.1 hypothetical protein BA195_05875 [Tenacibaculum soleae]
MTNYYVPLFLLFIGIYLIQIGVFSRQYTKKLAPYLWNGKINWNPNVDRLKLLFSLTLLIAPGTLMKSLIRLNSSNATINYLGFGLIIGLLIFFIWFQLKKIPMLIPFTKETNNQVKIKAGRKKISQYKLVALKYLLEEKFYRKDSFLQSDKDRITICKMIVKKEKKITNSGTLKNAFNKLTKENLESLFKKDEYKVYVPILLENDFIKERIKIKSFLEKFQ